MGFPSIATIDGTPIVGLGPGKPLAMLVYLAVRGEARREELVEILWGDTVEANARNAFRQALHRLRTALGEDLVPLDRERVTLTGGISLWTDRDSFLQALDRNEPAKAIELYRGDFLEGFDLGEPAFDAWVDAERMRLRARFQVALQTATEASLNAGRWLEALQFVQRLSAVAPLDESAALLEASVLVAAGRGSEAVLSLRRFTQLLHDQLGLSASPRVRETLARIERSEAREGQAALGSPAPRRATLFVGREEELTRLMALSRGLQSERGATVLIEGPSGIGKTRLVDEFLLRVRALSSLTVLRGRERPGVANLPYASIAEALRGILKVPGLAGTGRHLLGEASRILPELRDQFDIPEPAPIDAEGGRLRFFEGIAALLDSAAYERSICLVLDDLHNASSSTLDLVMYLCARLQTSPVLIALLYRDDEGTAAARLRALAMEHAESDQASEAGLIDVGKLPAADIKSLIESLVVIADGQLDVDRIAPAADGNPLRAIELARRALDGEMPSALPARLRDILWSRLQKSSPSQRRVFFAAALFQRRSPVRLLAAASHLPEAAAYDAAQALDAAGLLTQDGDGYVVAHAFTTTFVSEASGLAGRSLLAGWAADALVAEPGTTSAELAHLYALAGQQAKAFDFTRRAAYDAASIGAMPEVHRLLGLALTLAPDAQSRSDVETALAAFGNGRRLLSSPDSERAAPTTPTETPPTPTPSVDRPEDRPAATVLNQPRQSFVTPRLSWLTLLLVAVTAVLVWQRNVLAKTGRVALQDSLLVTERGKPGSDLMVITGPLADAASRPMANLQRFDGPAWARGLDLPWINRTPSSQQDLLAAERMTASGTHVYLFVNDTANPILVAGGGGGNNIILGWAPDGRALLVRRAKTKADGAFDADLWAYRVDGRTVQGIPIDTSSATSVQEARWSPDGSRIAWVAQADPDHQQDVFVSRADGTDQRNLTMNPAEDYHISWSSDGGLLAFTSDRRGNPDIFALELENDSPRLWSLTATQFAEDYASFSPDRRYVAFQSTREGDAAVYIMPALGGAITRLTPSGGQFSIFGWRPSGQPTYVDRLRITGPSNVAIGDSIELSILAMGRDGTPRTAEARLSLLDSGVAALRPLADDAPRARHFALAGIKAGAARVAVSVPGWRYDTLTVRVGGSVQPGLSDDFRAGIRAERWRKLGVPTPFVGPDASGTPALFPNGDFQWQSGLLSVESVSIRDGIDVAATFTAPFAGQPMPAALLELSLVADARDQELDPTAPQLSGYVGVAWDGETGRLTYSVGAESKSDPISTLGTQTRHTVRFVIDAGGSVAFSVDGKPRWSSSLRFLGGARGPMARVWLGGRASGSGASINNLVVTPLRSR